MAPSRQTEENPKILLLEASSQIPNQHHMNLERKFEVSSSKQFAADDERTAAPLT